MKTTGHNIKWDHFDILAFGKTDFHCKIKDTLLIQQELQPSLNVNVSRQWEAVAFLRVFFFISVPDPYCKLYKQFSNTVTVTFENVGWLTYETSSLSKYVYSQCLSPLFVIYSLEVLEPPTVVFDNPG